MHSLYSKNLNTTKKYIFYSKSISSLFIISFCQALGILLILAKYWYTDYFIISFGKNMSIFSSFLGLDFLVLFDYPLPHLPFFLFFKIGIIIRLDTLIFPSSLFSCLPIAFSQFAEKSAFRILSLEMQTFVFLNILNVMTLTFL